jgi:predicted aconitase with swiveling domain
MEVNKMIKTYKGRPLFPGQITGTAVVSKQGFNPLASYKDTFMKRKSEAICGDQDNKDLYGKQLSKMILCLPQVIGSTTGGIVISTASFLDVAPIAMLFANRIDSLAACGVIFSDIWVNKRIITIDQLGQDFLKSIKDGDIIEIKEDGSVIIKD